MEKARLIFPVNNIICFEFVHNSCANSLTNRTASCYRMISLTTLDLNSFAKLNASMLPVNQRVYHYMALALIANVKLILKALRNELHSVYIDY
jgi:hypothetical protein